MDEEFDLDELMALQEAEENRQQQDEEMEMLRDFEESEAKENEIGLSSASQKEVSSKRPRDPFTETNLVKNVVIDEEEERDTEDDRLWIKSPSPKKQRRTSLDNRSQADAEIAEEEETSSYIRNLLEKNKNKKVFKRIPDGEYQDVTMSCGDRFYLRLLDQNEAEIEVKVQHVDNNKIGLCGVQFTDLLEEAMAEQSRMSLGRLEDDEEEQDNAVDSSYESSSEDETRSELWVEKFRPRSFVHLLSDDGTNRTLLHWLKLWDVVVFNKPKKVKKPPKVENVIDEAEKKKNHFKKNFELPKVEEEYDAHNRPAQKFALLHGPPGLGKTTLAHVIANHAGYNVVEMNASDDRSLNTFKSKVEAATQMKSVSSKDQRPNCLIIDEIDGAPAPTINFLVSLITKSGASSKSSNKKLFFRPIICICNDLYVPSLRPLKQHSLLLSFPPTLPTRLSQRLLDIARKEKLSTSTTALLALCEKTDNDIRSCLSTLQFYKSRGKEMRLADVHKANVGQKDVQKSLFTVWKEIFQIPRGSVKKWQTVSGKSVLVEESASTIPRRYQTILKTIQSCGEFEKVMNGVYENYLDMKFKDSQLQSVTGGLEWFGFFDQIYQEISHSQIYTLMGYAPYALVQSHLLFGSLTKGKLQYPYAQAEKRSLLNKNRNIIAAAISEMSPSEKAFVSNSSIVFDMLPFIIDIIQPNLRPVNTQLYSAREREELNNVVRTMRSFNLTYHQERSPDGQYTYRLDPAIEEVSHFPDVKKAVNLSYALKQLIAHEIDIDKMRNHENSKRKERPTLESNNTSSSVSNAQMTKKNSSETKEKEEGNSTSSLTPSHLQKLQAKKISVKERIPVDFFGRKIVVKPNQDGNSDDGNSNSKNSSDVGGGGIISSDIWFKFKEGYNNAVRKNVKIKAFL